MKTTPIWEDSSETNTNLTDPVILGKIDQLFACNVGHVIDLPQLVVVGDQSSGKSSVLQGLTNLPFPRDSGLCTRFVTQITFRRSPEKRMSVRIIPSKDATVEHAQRTRAWSKLDIVDLDEKIFSEIMTEVHTVMGIDSKDGIAGKTFSDDKLHLEISGPDQQHLSVVDVPGIFKKTTAGVTTKDDMKMVEHMVESYVKNTRSVILAVVPANVDTATQCILEMAEEHDPTGQRTLGVLTKPDLVDQGAERNVMDLLEGRAHKLALGWCVVRNLGQKDAENGEDRHAKENMFFRTTDPWKHLNNDQVGIEALQIRLRDLLTVLTRREFPAVRTELTRKLNAMKRSLEQLGPSRDKSEEQSQYLTAIASRFQALATAALSATYVNDIFDEHENLRLATLVVNRFESFTTCFQKYGHTYAFDSAVGQGSVGSDDDGDEKDEEKDRDSEKSSQPFVIGKDNDTRQYPDQLELDDILATNAELADPISPGMSAWLASVHRGSRGFELGTFESGILSTTIKAQSTKWQRIIQGYVSDIVSAVHEFFATLVKVLCPDEKIRTALTSMLLDKLASQYRKAFVQAQFILQVERMEMPSTSNHYFNDSLEKRRQARLQEQLAKHSISLTDNRVVVELSQVVKQHHMSNAQHAVVDMQDILSAYYKVARKRIVDVIHMQAVGHHLLFGDFAPLKIFSPSFIAKLTAEQLEEIAGEDDYVKRKRAELKKGIENLEKGKAILC